jgi:uncharacterized cupin superfamily protein/glyoxylase-like metal-dependent hydrolase (beta-lactamase superfamily II)
MRSTIVPGVWFWSQWQPDRNLDFNGFFIEDPEGNIVVDPIQPDEATLAELVARGVATIVVTNRDHERASAALAAATGAAIVASIGDGPLMARAPDRTVKPDDLIAGWRVIGLDGMKTAGEIALYDRTRKAAIVGDAIWGSPAGALTLMPDAKLIDPVRAALSARMLRAHAIDHLLVGDGACIFEGAHAAIGAMLDARHDAYTNKVNLFDELTFWRFDNDPLPFTGEVAEVGRLIGAEKLGYGVGKLARGAVYCPLHWHTREEELFVVLRGTPTLRTPRGTTQLRPGDCIAFRTEPGGAHQLRNDTDEECLVLLVANIDRGDVCFYPDSQKFVVEATGTLVRDFPQLDYYDGESGRLPAS